jgi:hypothetical protein
VRAAWVVIAALAVGCGRRQESAPAQDTAVRVVLHVDDEPATTLALDAARPIELAAVVPAAAPPAAWKDVLASAPGGRMAVVQRPQESFAGQRAVLDVVAGQPRFAMVRTVDPALPADVRAVASAPTVSLVGVTEVFVRTRERPPSQAATEPSLELVVRGHAPRRWTRSELAAIPVTAPPGLGERRGGWDVGALATRDAAGARLRGMQLIGRDGRRVALDAAQLADRIVLVKFNRRGQAKARIWARSASREPIDELADLVTVEAIVDP